MSSLISEGNSRYLKSSIERQKLLMSVTLPMTPVDSITPFLSDVDTSFLHGFYASDKNRTISEQKKSAIQFSGRQRITYDINMIHKELANILKASSGSLRLLSGLHAHMVVFMALADIGDKVLLIPTEAGGHFSTEKILERLGLQIIFMPIDYEKKCIDKEKTLQTIEKHSPKFIFIDRSEGLKYEDFSFLSSCTKSIKIFDASQYLPQIMYGEYCSPFEWGFDLILFTLHKSFPGPQKAGIVTKEDNKVWQDVQKGMSSFVSSSHIENSYKFGLSLLKKDELKEFSKKLSTYSFFLEKELEKYNIPIFPRELQGDDNWPFTQHIWIVCSSQDSAFDLYQNLSLARIQTNYRLLPYGLGWGLRLGINAIISLNISLKDLEEIALVISSIYHNGYTLDYRHHIRSIREKMNIRANRLVRTSEN